MVVAEHIDDATRQQLIDFLVAYDDQAYFTEVIKKDNARFIPCSIEDYAAVIELNKILNED